MEHDPLFDGPLPVEVQPLREIGVNGSESAMVAMCEQGTDEWLKLRKGIVTASSASAVVTSLGQPTKGKGRETYLCKLVGGLLLKHRQEESVSSQAIDRGHYLEPKARAAYELATGSEVRQVGFVWRDETKQAGCSPDGLLPDLGLEIKCPMQENAVRYLIKGKVPTDYIVQIQFSMWVTGLPCWDFCSYHNDSGIPIFIKAAEPDEKLHAAFNEHIPAFMAEVTETAERLKERAA